ncbi:MAG: hypothetical protein M1816_005998 [Peltula sp. TS41687]|nr:MAG: hypothetical protein M1816_005998 [Peltula sp. TS41687]
MAGHNDPRLLYSIPNVSAYHLQNGQESPLTPSGSQTLSLLMVPTSSPFADLSNADPQSAAPEEDFYLHLHLPPEVDLAIPATTQIYHQPPNSYLIPRWDLGPDSGAFTRIEFPPIGAGPGRVSQEDIDTFETILAQCTAFLEKSHHQTSSGYPAEKGGQGIAPYNPQDYRPGEGYAQAGHSGNGSPQHGHIVLVDEENGSVVGELSEGFNVVEDSNVKHGSKNPVEIQLPQDPSSNQINVSTAPPEYLRDAMHPAYQGSKIVSNAAAASRLIVDTTGQISQMINSSAQNFTQKTKSNPKPLTFTPTTHDRVRKINAFTQSAAGLSAKTVGQVSKYAQNIGAMARRGKATDKNGKQAEGYKPGILNKSLMAFSTVADGIDQGARNLLTSGSTAATTVIGHRYGPEAGEVTRQLAGGAKNVGLVYVDAMGVSRRAVVKSVAKGMIVGRVKGGGDLVVGGGDGGLVVPSRAAQDGNQGGLAGTQAVPGTGQVGTADPGVGVVGFGNAVPPAYSSGVGEPLGSAALQGQDSTIKR